MLCYVYVIENAKGKRYIGVASDLEKRLKKHNQHGSSWTKHNGPWRLIHEEIYQSKQDALFREIKLKSYKGGEALKRLIRNSSVDRSRLE